MTASFNHVATTHNQFIANNLQMPKFAYNMPMPGGVNYTQNITIKNGLNGFGGFALGALGAMNGGSVFCGTPEIYGNPGGCGIFGGYNPMMGGGMGFGMGSGSPFIDTNISSSRGFGPFGGYNSFSMSQEVNDMGKGFIIGKLGTGIANIFVNKKNGNPIQNFYNGMNNGVYGMLNQKNAAQQINNQNSANNVDFKKNLQGIYSEYTVLDNEDGTFSLTKGDNTIYKKGTFEELTNAAIKAGEATTATDSKDEA